MIRRAALSALCLALAGTLARPQDLRDQFGTRSQEAAMALDHGLKLCEQKQYPQALAKFKRAVELDRDFQLAHYWVGITYADIGEIDQSIAEFKKAVEAGERTRHSSTSVDACVNIGLMSAKVGREDESWPWFTRAILLDPDNFHKLHAKAYRNMALALHRKQRKLAAAIVATLGYQADPKFVEKEMVQDYIKNCEGEEAAQILHFPREDRAVPPRTAPTQIDAQPSPAEIDAPVREIHLDARNRRMFVLADKGDRYFIVDYAAGNKVTRVQAPGEISALAVEGNDLFLAVGGPPRIVQVAPAAGTATRSWNLPVAPPRSLAVMRPNGLIAFPLQRILHVLDLDSGTLERTTWPSVGVATDPRQKFCYSFVTPEARATSGHIIIDGQPVFFHLNDNDWLQSTLYRFAAAGKKLLPASMRMNAASNGWRLHVSPDARWVGLTGGGGWRPDKPGIHKAGYGTALLPADDFENVQGFYATELHSQALAVNPVTSQVASLQEADVRVYTLADPAKAVATKGPFGSACAWSGDGRFLYVADKTTGLRIFRNQLSKEEESAATAWLDTLQKSVAAPAAGAKAAEPVAELSSFKVLSQKPELLKAIQRAEKEGRTTKPADWGLYPPYDKGPAVRTSIDESFQLVSAKDYGTVIYRAREMKAKVPDHPVFDLLLGISFWGTRQFDKAEPAFVAAIQADQGRTSLTSEALRGLSATKRDAGDAVGSAFCYARLLLVDLVNPRFVDEAAVAFQRAGVEAESKKLLEKARSGAASMAGGSAPAPAAPGRRGSGPPPVVAAKLPALPKPPSASALKATDLYTKVAPSVVRVETANGGGSGVCVGAKGWILTNAHVVADSNGAIQVIPFGIASGKLQKLAGLKATIAFYSEAQDVAVLKVEGAPASLVPLAVIDRDVKAAEKVYAIGSPGLGGAVLEQSITDGIVSSPLRQIAGGLYVQHTAAVNPGNSGGPVLDERGQLLGLVTLKAELENVGFAIPAKTLREIFEKASK